MMKEMKNGGYNLMSKVATANIVITLEYSVEQTFEDDMSIHDMRDNWEVFMDLNDYQYENIPEYRHIKRVIPDDWSVIQEDIEHIECEGEQWPK